VTVLYTDRSRIETGEHCERKRYWQYHYLGKGLEKVDDLKLDARIGTWTHWGIEQGLHLGDRMNAAECATGAGEGFIADCKGNLGTSLMDQPPQLQHDVIEGGQIVTALVYAWLRVKAPRLLQDGEVLAIEKELTVDFSVATAATVTHPVLMNETIVRLMARPDIIWRRRQDGTIFIRNLKTVRKADDKWREKWALDMQTLSEPLAVDEWLRRNVENTQPDDVCGGVIIDGLVTGEVLFDKYKQVFYHNNPLVYAWHQSDESVLGGSGIFYPRYEYSCTAPHKLGNGHKCEGGKLHRLGKGVTKVSVAERYPGGIISWIDNLIDNDPMLIDEMLIELPPIIRSDYQIERWKRQVLPREVRINRDAARVNAALPDVRAEHILDDTFPMSTAGGNCLYPGKCMAYNLCHGSAAIDPLNSGFRYRTFNHPTESETISEKS